MNRDEIINMVKLKMDEFTPFEENELVSAGMVEMLLNSAANNIVAMFPPHLFHVFDGSSIVPSPKDDGSGYFPAPNNMGRFIRLKLIGWEKPVYNLITEADPRYKLQSDKYLRGGIANPVAAYVGGRIIEYYSLPTSHNHTISEFDYIEKLLPEELNDELVDALTWECARLVFSALQDNNGMTVCQNNVLMQLQLANAKNTATGRE